MAKPDQQLLLSLQDSVACITINRPEAHNALSRSMWQSLPGLFEQARQDGARVVILTGSGTSFASGADLQEVGKIDSYAAAGDFWSAIKDCLAFIWAFDLPTLCMVNGACLGGGCLLALACDMRIAGSNASFGIPVARLGIVLDDANIQRLVDLVGPAVAREMLYCGDTIPSGRAEILGLVNQTVEQESLAEVVKLRAQHIAANSGGTINSARQSINRVTANSVEDNQEQVLQSYLSEDFRARAGRRNSV